MFSFLSVIAFSQTENRGKIDLSKLPELRSNSRDITPVRRSNLHKPATIQQNSSMDNSKRAEFRKKRSQFKSNKMMMNKQRLMQMRKQMQQKAINQRRR